MLPLLVVWLSFAAGGQLLLKRLDGNPEAFLTESDFASVSDVIHRIAGERPVVH
jgi:hypothetical protein